MIVYKKINNDNREQLLQLMDTVLNSLERKEFFIPFTKEEIEDLFCNEKTCMYGAFDNDTLVGTAQLYFRRIIC